MAENISDNILNNPPGERQDKCFFCRQQIEDLERFFYLSSDLFCLIDQKGCLTWVNLSMTRSLGYSKKELVSRKFVDFIHPDDKSKVLSTFEKVPACQISPTIEIRLLTKEGSYKYFEWYIYRDSENKLYYSVARDISDKKEYQKELLRLESIVQGSLDAIYAIDKDGLIMTWNKAAEKIFGYSKDEIIGRPIYVLGLPGQQEELDNIISKIRRGETYSYETIRKKKTGELVSVYITLAPIKDTSGKIIGTSAVARDITGHQKLEKEIAQLDKLNTIVELASVISHEVRNPMTTVKGFLELLNNKLRDKGYQEYFEIMIEEMDRVNSILQEFITIGKNKESKKAKHNLNKIIKSMAPLLEADAVYLGKTIRIELNEIPDLYVNDNEIRQLILNLTRNGLEAMEQKGTVTIKTFLKDRKVVLAVQDQGKGIDPENIPKLGSPFFSTKETGTGLGLYVCYEIAERHDAKINVATSPKGTTFFVEFSPEAR